MKTNKPYGVLLLLSVFLVACGGNEEIENRPLNVVFILVDDLGNHDLGYVGSDYYETPHIDRLAAQSMNFTHGYAASRVCSPSRASIMTGLYPTRHGITDWIGAKTDTTWRSLGRHDKLLPAPYVHQLLADYTTLPEALKLAGYQTFFAGKWHLGEQGSYPEDHGFDISFFRTSIFLRRARAYSNHALEALGLANNTIVIFTSDNGGVASGDNYTTSNLPLRGGKGYQWEGGIREPYLIRVPGLNQGGATTDVPVSGIDFYPTILDLVGADVAQEQALDGVSLVPVLQGQPMNERALFWHYPHYGNQGGEPSSLIREGHWKLIPDPLYNAPLDAQRDAYLVNELLPELEQERRAMLSPDWQPNADWWGSQPTAD